MQQIGKSEKKLFRSFFEYYPQPQLSEVDKLIQNLDYALQQVDKLSKGEIFSAFPKFYEIKQILSKFVDFILHQYLHSDEGEQIAQECQNAKIMIKKITRKIEKTKTMVSNQQISLKDAHSSLSEIYKSIYGINSLYIQINNYISTKIEKVIKFTQSNKQKWMRFLKNQQDLPVQTRKQQLKANQEYEQQKVVNLDQEEVTDLKPYLIKSLKINSQRIKKVLNENKRGIHGIISQLINKFNQKIKDCIFEAVDNKLKLDSRYDIQAYEKIKHLQELDETINQSINIFKQKLQNSQQQIKMIKLIQQSQEKLAIAEKYASKFHKFLKFSDNFKVTKKIQEIFEVGLDIIDKQEQKLNFKDQIDKINDQYLISPSRSHNKIFVFNLQSKAIVKDLNFQYRFNDGFASLLPVKNSCYIASDSSRSNKFIQLFVNETKQLQNMPVARCHTSLCLFDRNTIYCTGGFNGNAAINAAHFYEIDKGKWTQVSAMNSVKHSNSTIGYMNFVFTFGGVSSNKYCQRLNHLEYNKPWTVLNVQNNPINAQNCKGFSRDNKIIVFHKNNIVRYSVADDGNIIFEKILLNTDPSGHFQKLECPLIVWKDQVIVSFQNLICSFNINGILQQ